MNAEIRFENGNLIIRITDIVSRISKDFGPFGSLEAEEILRDYDCLREMFKNG